MEPSRFDDLTKALATSTSRRHALKTIAATALGSILGLGGIGTAFANCKPNGIGCNTNSQCCSGGCCHGTCTDLGTTSNCGTCGHRCASGQGCCNGTCTDLNTIQNCGSCGNVCPAGQMCSDGQCVCPLGRTKLCNGTCATNCLSTGCSNGCNCVQDAAVGNFYCAQGAATQGCSSDCDCPSGQMCINGGVCVAVC